MRFLAKYIPVKHDAGNQPYYRTVDADSVNEAVKLAGRFAKKGFIMSNVKQQEGAVQ